MKADLRLANVKLVSALPKTACLTWYVGMRYQTNHYRQHDCCHALLIEPQVPLHIRQGTARSFCTHLSRSVGCKVIRGSQHSRTY